MSLLDVTLAGRYRGELLYPNVLRLLWVLCLDCLGSQPGLFGGNAGVDSSSNCGKGMTSQAGLNVVGALSNRAQREQEAQEDWEDSIKPSTVTGNGQIKQLGSNPLASNRILTNTTRGTGAIATTSTVGGLIGDWVPRFEGEEVLQTYTKEKIAYSAIFTREVPGGRTQWTDLEMLQRDPALFNVSDDWVMSASPWDFIQSALNDRTFYYWNGSTIQELFTHQSSTLVASGTDAYDGNNMILLQSISVPGDLENGMARLNFSINDYIFWGGYYFVILTGGSGSPSLRIRSQTWDGTVLNSSATAGFTFSGTNYRSGVLSYKQTNIDSNPGPWRIQLEGGSGTVTWELYRVWNHGAYLTTTGSGTSFAHITNGNNGDGRTRIRYFSGTGKKPASLTETTLNQTQAELYWQSEPVETRLEYPGFDWRRLWLITTSTAVNNPSQTQFSGMADPAVQYTAVEGSKREGFLYAYQGILGDGMLSLFGVGGTGVDMDPKERNRADDFDPDTGAVTAFGLSTEDSLSFPNIDLSSFGTEGVDYYVEDICTPDYYTANRVAGTYWWLPFLAIYPTYVRRTR